MKKVKNYLRCLITLSVLSSFHDKEPSHCSGENHAPFPLFPPFHRHFDGCAAQARGHRLFYFQQGDLFVSDGRAWAAARQIEVSDKEQDYFRLYPEKTTPLESFDCILMRKDPPFDMEYIYTTYMLEMAEQQGVLVVNPPAALRQVNEKFFIAHFPELTPKTLITRDLARIREFVRKEKEAVVKPLDGMGGMGIFRLADGDSNTNAILETLGNGRQTLMVQGYLKNVTRGDKRILLVDGQAPQYGLARIPQQGEFRANLAAGGKGVVEPLSEQEKALCAAIRPKIEQLGLLFVGLDVIDGHITEINVTSPTCIREIAAATGENIAERLIIAIEEKLETSNKL